MSRTGREGRADSKAADDHDEPPPVLGSWRNLYALVLGVLIVLILLFGWFSRAFS